MKREDLQPTVWDTLAQQWAISRALWADYWQCKREARRRAKRQRPFTISLGQPGHEDTLYWALVVVAVLAACLVVFMQIHGVR